MVAQPPSTQDDPGGQGEDFGKSSPVGLLVLLLFFVAVAFLVRSMTKHLKRVPASFDPAEQAEPPSERPAEDTESETAPPSNGDQKDSSDGGASER
ncbi:hypothetical protein [Actinophytocola sp.]|uniref:hypothetical protein n=1 Tax=Actinophytocola sp. TaxID=1872138 RepID=UPI0025BCB6D0|nr:hypothetical protein [Actinophytocola sp.]